MTKIPPNHASNSTSVKVTLLVARVLLSCEHGQRRLPNLAPDELKQFRSRLLQLKTTWKTRGIVSEDLNIYNHRINLRLRELNEIDGIPNAKPFISPWPDASLDRAPEYDDWEATSDIGPFIYWPDTTDSDADADELRESKGGSDTGSSTLSWLSFAELKQSTEDPATQVKRKSDPNSGSETGSLYESAPGYRDGLLGESTKNARDSQRHIPDALDVLTKACNIILEGLEVMRESDATNAYGSWGTN